MENNIYERFGIYELRRIAKNKGVKAPTKLKKYELIEQIQKIDNEIAFGFVNTNRGRPAKDITVPEIKIYPCSQCPLLKKIDYILFELDKLKD